MGQASLPVQVGRGALSPVFTSAPDACPTKSDYRFDQYPPDIVELQPLPAAPAAKAVPSLSAWVINDTVSGTFFQELKILGYEVQRCVDVRMLTSGSTTRINLLEDLKLSQPVLLAGVLKAPASHVGTTMERTYSQSLSDLLSYHVQ